MKYIARVMTMGDMSPAGLSDAFYNSPDGEPEDIVVGHIGFYSTKEEFEANIDADVYEFEEMTGCTLEEGGGWVEIEEIDDEAA
jgi:hypothetical protein